MKRCQLDKVRQLQVQPKHWRPLQVYMDLAHAYNGHSLPRRSERTQMQATKARSSVCVSQPIWDTLARGIQMGSLNATCQNEAMQHDEGTQSEDCAHLQMPMRVTDKSPRL